MSCSARVPDGKITADTKFDSTDFRSTIPCFNDENRRENHALLDLLDTFAERKRATSAQIALAWLLAKKPWIVPTQVRRRRIVSKKISEH